MATSSLIRLALDEAGVEAPPRAMRRRRRQGLRWLERLLLLVGVLCVTYYLYTYVEASLYQAFEDRELDEILNSATASTPPTTSSGEVARAAASRRTIATGATVGRIEIPRLGVSAVIRAGSDARTLRLAVGYIPGTALPGDSGNVGLAGHRDTFFRKLRDVNPDDEIRIVTQDGVFRYYVQRTTVVKPEDVWVLDPTNYPALTLVTCYPFNYIGSAPQRFIVRATLGKTDTAADSVAATAGSALTKPVATKGTIQRKRSAVRSTGAAKKSAAVRPTLSKPARPKAGVELKQSTVPSKLPPVKRPRVRPTTRSASERG